MEFKEKLPEWLNQGVEPPKSKRESGWSAGDKPPADWFNWFQHRTFKNIEELREACKQLGLNIENIDFSDVNIALNDIENQLENKVGRDELVSLINKDIDKINIDGLEVENLGKYDFDEVRDTGVYRVWNRESSPTGTLDDYILVVYNHNGKIFQTAYTLTDKSSFKNKVFVRTHYDDSWSSWEELVNKSYVDGKYDDLKQSGVESNRILVDGLNSKGVNATVNDTIRTNVKKVKEIYSDLQIPLQPTTNLVGIQDDKSVELTWRSPDDVTIDNYDVTKFKKDVLVRNSSRIPKDINDGIIIGEFSKDKHRYTAYKDTTVSYDKTYYYRVFSISDRNLVSPSNSIKVEVLDVINIEELPVGTIIQDPNTKYYDEPIKWVKIAQDHYGMNETTLLAQNIITYKSFDAKEPEHTNENKSQYGNNRYKHSNLRQWLNSNETHWYLAQYFYDQNPNKDNVYNGYNAYDSEPGFLTNFSGELIDAILPTNLKVTRTRIDGGGTETVNDNVFLLSSVEVGFSAESTGSDGKHITFFDSNEDRMTTPTEKAKDNDESNNNYKYWWLRTPRTENPNYRTNAVAPSGNRTSSDPYRSMGVRPALNLKNDTKVYPKPNSDGSYNLIF